ncbi:MAG: hypothetical protein LBQ81_00455 [Zoogloeaceae bacterium]|nr:hypothetical protein [Zoogloeaceae bacterium]
MNHNDIYGKTPAGEESMIHRAKAEERKQRMILVLIDGKTSVGEISEKVGDNALTELAIITLVAEGFIVLEKAGDATRPPKAPVQDPVSPETAAPQQAVSVPQQAVPVPQRQPASALPPPVASPPPTLAAVLKKETALSGATSSAQPVQKEEFTLPSFNRASPVNPDVAAQAEEAVNAEERRARRKLRRSMRRVLWALGGVLLAFCVGLAGIYLYSYDAQRQALEEWLAQGLGVPVRVGQVTPVLLPKPMLELRQIQIGDVPDQNRIDLIRLPGLFSRVFGLPFSADDRVEISGGSLDTTLLATWRGGSAPGRIIGANFQQLEIRLGEYNLATFEGNILFASDGGLKRADLRSKALRLEVTPLNKESCTVTVTAGNGWQPVQDFPIKLLDFSGAMQVYSDHLRLEKGDMHLMGGRYEGDLDLSWRDGKVREMSGKGVLTGVRITDLLKGMGFARPAEATQAALELDGDLSGALRFRTSGDTSELWRKNLEASGEMKVDRSVLQGMDLIRLMRGGGKGKITRRSGTTRFSRLNFNVNVNSDGLKLENLQLRATSLRGEGGVSVDSEGELSGRITLLLFDGEGGPGSNLVLSGRYPLLETELREAP